MQHDAHRERRIRSFAEVPDHWYLSLANSHSSGDRRLEQPRQSLQIERIPEEHVIETLASDGCR